MSLFAVPKRLVNADGSLGERNDVRCVSIEHKLGIHASPTCVLSYGDNGGAIGYLVGEPHHGLEYMFVMMNAARLSVGVQGVGRVGARVAAGAFDWAHERVQGREPGSRGDAPHRSCEHPDVRRMLLTIKANVEAMRALALYSRAAARSRPRRTPTSRGARARSRAGSC